MRFRHLVFATAITLCLVPAAVAFAPAAATADTVSPVVGHVYVNDNTTGTNTIAAFARHADGSLSALPGSPFAAGGAGTGAGLASQGALQLSGEGRYLIAVDAGSNQISTLRIQPDGGLIHPVARWGCRVGRAHTGERCGAR
jgi:6-phosphogluconolactonase